VRRVRLVDACAQAGLPLEGIGAAIAQGRLSLAFLDRLSIAGQPLTELTYAQLCGEQGLPMELVRRVHEASGLGRPQPDDPVHPLDRDLLGSARLGRMLGLDDGVSTTWSSTSRRGDRAAAALADLVEQVSLPRGGQPVKWLGDGVMFHFRRPGQAVVAALEMVERTPQAGLPPAHVGLHAGPVVFQDGDYFGRTVNLAARIAGHAGPGQVLVSDQVVAACPDGQVAFEPIGPVPLKGVADPVPLHRRPARVRTG
jgi:class 3 adenylate cyclase